MDPRPNIWYLFMAFAFMHCCKSINAEKLKLCLVENTHTTKRIHTHCPKLNVLGSPIVCVTDVDRFSCLRQLSIGEADLAILEPEDLIAVAAYNEYNVLVTNELRLFPNDKQHFEMVALVHKSIKHIWDTKGKRFCHPGFSSANDWTQPFSTYFENWITPRECDPDKTLLENRVNALSNYFEMGCIAGPWSPDTIFDGQLKLKYKNLCAACDNPTSCYNSDKYFGRQGALLCLTDNAGDIAWVRLDDTLVHFKNEKINKQDYNYLCPDGTTRPVNFEKPCVWISKPWQVIVSRSQIAEKIANIMNSLKTEKFGWEPSIIQLMEGHHITPVSTENLETPEDFLARFSGFMSANNRAGCRPSRRVQWCVASNLEDRKCRWLREASIVYGIEPPISCIQEVNRVSCLEAVRNQRADIFVAEPAELLQARKKGLKPIIHAMSNKKQESNRIAAIVQYDSKFKSLKDLRYARACFTGYRSVDWNTFALLMKNASGDNWDCSDAKAIAQFFKDSCVLGLNDKDRSELSANLYSLCKQGGKAGNDVSTFDCLTSDLADVAFVNLKAIEKKTFNFNGNTSGNKKYRILCLNEEDAEKQQCLLTWTTLSSVIAHENITDIRHEEIYAMLLEMDNLFGTSIKGQTSAFSLYGVYDKHPNVIFPGETRHLQLHGHHLQLQGIQSYDQIIEDILKQKSCNAANKLKFRPFDIISITIIIVGYTQLTQLLNY